MKTSLLIISFSDIRADARVLKQVRAFSDEYDLTTCGFGDAPLDGAEHIQVGKRESPRPGRIMRHLIPRLDGLLSRARIFRWTYSRISYVAETKRALRGRRFDVVLANDVDTVPIAIAVAGRRRVHADLHEFFPGLHEDHTELQRRQTAYLTWLVRRFAARASSATTVSHGIAEAYRAFGVQCAVVTNATPFAALSPTAVHHPLRIVHSGIAQPSRQLELTMRAVAESTADVTLDLFLMPNDVVYLDGLRRLADELGSRVSIRDPLPQGELVTGLNGYDLGVFVLPPTSFNTANALPNKFFDFVQARLGMVIGPTPSMVEILEEHDLGAVTAGFSVSEIRATLDGLIDDRVSQWKANADAASVHLSAERQIAVWSDALRRIVQTTPRIRQ